MSATHAPHEHSHGDGRPEHGGLGDALAHDHPNPNPHDDPSVGPIAFYGLAGSLVFVAIVIWLAALVFSTQSELTAERVYRAEAQELVDLKSRQLANIHAYKIVDKSKGVVAIPIDRAMQIVAKELAAEGAVSGGGAAPAGQPRGGRP